MTARPIALIVAAAAPADDARALHDARLANLAEYLTVHEWEVVVDRVRADGVDRVLLVDRTGAAAAPLVDGLARARSVEHLDWSDLDAYVESHARDLGPAIERLHGELADVLERVARRPASRASVVSEPAPSAEHGATEVAAPAHAASGTSSAAAPGVASDPRPIIAFVGEDGPRALAPGAAVAADGAFSASLAGDDLVFDRLAGTKPERFAGWASAHGFAAPARVLAAGRSLGRIRRVLVTDPTGTGSVVEGMPAKRLSTTPAIAGVLLDSEVLLVGPDGRQLAVDRGLGASFTALATIAGVDATVRGSASYLVAWGLDATGAPIAEVLARSTHRLTWRSALRIDDVVRAGLERPGALPRRSEPALLTCSADGTARTLEIGAS